MSSWTFLALLILNTIYVINAYSVQNALIRREQRQQSYQPNRVEEYGYGTGYNRGRRHIIKNNNKRNNYFSGMMQMMDSMDDDDDDDVSDDKYSDKKQVIAFVLSLCLGGVGAGRFYIGDYGLASLKLIFGLILCCSPLIFL
eukprot:735208_1